MNKKVLFVIKHFDVDLPRIIRTKKIISELNNEFEFHILTLVPGSHQKNILNDFRIHKASFSFLGELIFKNSMLGKDSNYKNSAQSNNNIKPIYNKVNTFIIRFVSKFRKIILFPDDLILSFPSILRSLKNLIKIYSFDIIIGMIGGEYSLCLLGKFIKKYDANIKWIIDLGDPFLVNGILEAGRIRKIIIYNYEKYYLKYINDLIVTNNKTKEHYIKTYSSTIKSEKIHVIPQGADLVEKTKYNYSEESKNKGFLNLIYAGLFYEKLREPFRLYSAINSFNKRHDKKVYLEIFGTIHSKFLPQPTNNFIKYFGRIDHKKLVYKYQKADVLVYIDNAFGIQTPGKIFELLMMAKPILFLYTNEESPTFEFVKNNSLLIITKDNESEIEKSFEKILINYHDKIPNFDPLKVSWKARSELYKNILV